jgi:alanyl-tRNA synthetase
LGSGGVVNHGQSLPPDETAARQPSSSASWSVSPVPRLLAQSEGRLAGAVVTLAAQALGGGGGGTADLAQGGGTDATRVSVALGTVEDQLRNRGA